MFALVVHQRDPAILELDSIKCRTDARRALKLRANHYDAIDRVEVTIAQGIGIPILRHAGIDLQTVRRPVHAEQRFQDEPVQPAGRPRIPGPAGAAGVRRDTVDIRCHDVRLRFVYSDGLAGFRMVCRIDQSQQFPGALAVANRRKRHCSPDRGVRVLPAVLTYAGNVALDVTGIHRRLVEWRVEQLD